MKITPFPHRKDFCFFHGKSEYTLSLCVRINFVCSAKWTLDDSPQRFSTRFVGRNVKLSLQIRKTIFPILTLWFPPLSLRCLPLPLWFPSSFFVFSSSFLVIPSSFFVFNPPFLVISNCIQREWVQYLICSGKTVFTFLHHLWPKGHQFYTLDMSKYSIQSLCTRKFSSVNSLRILQVRNKTNPFALLRDAIHMPSTHKHTNPIDYYVHSC